jgi:hypothetical protein
MNRFLICGLLLGLVACGGTSTPTPKPTQKTVNDVVLTPTQISVPLSTFDIGAYGMQSVMVGNSIYFGNYSNTAKTQFFVRYDLASNTFSSPLATSTNVCACGYQSKLVSDGTNVFYIANDATKYTASSNSWSTINYPTTARDNAGEAGVTYANGNLYFVGGRTASNLFKYYSISQNTWFTAPNALYATTASQLVTFKDRIYAIGGSGAPTKMAYYSTTTNTWTPVKDVPFTVTTSYETVFGVALGNYIYLLQNDSVQIYDPTNDVWATTPVKITGLPSYGAMLTDGQNLYIAGKNASNVPAVTRVAVSFK